MKIAAIKCATAVRVGTAETLWIKADKAEVIFNKEEQRYEVTCKKTGTLTWVHITNVQYALPEVSDADNNEGSGVKSGGRAKKAATVC